MTLLSILIKGIDGTAPLILLHLSLLLDFLVYVCQEVDMLLFFPRRPDEVAISPERLLRSVLPPVALF